MKTVKGLSEKNIDQLIAFTNSDNDVQKNTSDLKRFANRELWKKWKEKGRKIYAMVDENDDLMGITWFGPESDGFTFAIRIYGNARGKGLSENFLRKTMEDFMKEPEYINAQNKSWWLETSKDNLPAIKIYEKLGFVKTSDGVTPDKAIYCKSF
jgi:ribosomal protein S18 acetylase RimI-like enzyme